MSSSVTAADLSGADCIYFLMFEGWERELRSNRWHYASRWARHLPVVLVQPVLKSDFEPAVSSVESRIPNTRILRVRSGEPRTSGLTRGPVQASQIHADMRAHGFSRPILWTYNPDFVFASELLPAALRVFHATENYFTFEKLSEGFLDRLKKLLSFTDLAIGVSEGVTASHRPFANGRAETVTNGCDYWFYARGKLDAALAELGKGWKKTVVYAGNINGRIDFELLNAVAQAYSDKLFVFFGPVSGIAGTPDLSQWNVLLSRKNVRYEGPADVERLPSIYATADLGLMPYKSTPALIGNLFPLKAFEMQAAGLPVISTFFNSLKEETGRGLHVTQDATAFTALVDTVDRRFLTSEDRLAIERHSRTHDYDTKFATVFAAVADLMARSPEVSAPALTAQGFAPLIMNPKELTALYLDAAPKRIGMRSALRAERVRAVEKLLGAARSFLPVSFKEFVKKRLSS